MEFLLAVAITCSDSREIIADIIKSQQGSLTKQELIEVIKINTEPKCYEGSEHNS